VKLLVHYITYYFSKVIPKQKNKWVFGSWFGTTVSDNSKWFFEYVRSTHSNIQCIYITKNNDHFNSIKSSGGFALKYGSMKSFFHILTAKVVFLTHGHGDLSRFNIIGGAFKVYFWHASVLLKQISFDTLKKKSGLLNFIKDYMLEKTQNYDLYITPSNEYRKIISKAFRAKSSKMIFTGLPKTTVFFNGKLIFDKKKFLSELSRNFHTNFENKIIITYMPTFRDNNSVFSFKNLNFNELKKLRKILNEFNAVIIEKNHFVDNKNKDFFSLSTNVINGIFSINNLRNIDSESLLYFTEILITDYSSSYADFAILDRPIIHYVYDYDYYKNKDRGLYHDISKFAAGKISYNFDELLKSIQYYLINKKVDSNLRKKFVRTFLTFSKSNSNEVIYDTIIRLTKL